MFIQSRIFIQSRCLCILTLLLLALSTSRVEGVVSFQEQAAGRLQYTYNFTVAVNNPDLYHPLDLGLEKGERYVLTF